MDTILLSTLVLVSVLSAWSTNLVAATYLNPKYHHVYSRSEQNSTSFRKRPPPPPPCKSNIYCEGDLLNDVQLGQLYDDSKTFVDLKLRYPEDKVIEKYAAFKKQHGGSVPVDDLRKFVNENFEEVDELEPWMPADFSDQPSIVDRVRDPVYKQWMIDLNDVWRVLARRVKDDVYENPRLYSFIPVPNGFIVPGGRFRELYYWDTYWIVNGLLPCDMHSTARGVLENMVSLVKRFGFIPNGSRKYYLNRSQPPLLIHMVDSYVKMTGDWPSVREHIKYLESEFMYWMRFKMVSVRKNGNTHQLARYFCYSRSPRPESYREDYLSASIFEDEEQRTDFYIKIKSAAESGMDFSSRWFVKDGQNKGNLSDIAAPQIIPVDLNAFLQANAKILSNWFLEMGNYAKAKTFADHALHLHDAIKEVLWHEDVGTWLDYDIVSKKRRNYFYVSNMTPIWTGSYDSSWTQQQLSDRVLGYIKSTGITQFVGGVPISLELSGEQWDFPNSWAPYQAMFVQGLDRIGTVEARNKAFELADLWIKSNFKGFQETQAMFEKYDVLKPGTNGGGGEYVSQTGFGWTNGVVFEFFDRWGNQLKSSQAKDDDIFLNDT
uniref:Trehalase n=1 Tax=Laodelphax striatellus TaxID=195883 RepID=I3WEV2_LAOST|nr:soluble trehalase [Laodelphax striatellus]